MVKCYVNFNGVDTVVKCYVHFKGVDSVVKGDVEEKESEALPESSDTGRFSWKLLHVAPNRKESPI